MDPLAIYLEFPLNLKTAVAVFRLVPGGVAVTSPDTLNPKHLNPKNPKP